MAKANKQNKDLMILFLVLLAKSLEGNWNDHQEQDMGKSAQTRYPRGGGN